MRLLHTFHDDRHAKTFSSYLIQQGIENQLEITKDSNWESDHYGDLTCKIWVIDEDLFAASKKYLETYLENPNADSFLPSNPIPAPPENKDLKFSSLGVQKKPIITRKMESSPATFCLIMLCSLILILSMMTRPTFESYPKIVPGAALFSSPIEKEFYFDYPRAYEIIDQIDAAYGIEKLKTPALLPDAGKVLLNKFYQTPYWRGLYEEVLAQVSGKEKFKFFQAPLFEKIRQGEIWRGITPCFLHGDILHLFFNMAWLLVIGRQMEKKLGIFRYLIFIILAGLFSNTAQYLMSGPDFIGFSGVLCGMIVFVWMRQKNTPWEGYQLHPSSMKFIVLFILLLIGVQTTSFALELMGWKALSIPIANTAHLSGALLGYLLSKLNLFMRKTAG